MVKSESPLLVRARTAAAAPLTPYRLFWLFALAALLGDGVEVVFWLVTRGQLTSRSSLVMGPFSLVWGIGAVLFTVTLHPFVKRSGWVLFAAGALVGGGFEYLCSLIQQWAFGVVFWYYGHLPLSLNSHVNLIFCLFWGMAAVVWMKFIHPLLCLLIDLTPKGQARRLTAALALFLAVSTVLTTAALHRMDLRQEGIPATGAVSLWLDETFPDPWLQARFPSMHPPAYYGE